MFNGKETLVRTCVVRGAFVNLKEPRAVLGQDVKKYSITLLFDPEDQKHEATLRELRGAIKAALVKKFGEDKKRWPATYRDPAFKFGSFLSATGRDGFPLRDGNNQAYEGFEDMVTLNLSSAEPIQVLDRDRSPLTGEDLKICRSGCKYAAIVSAFAYDSHGNKGVSFGVQGVMFVRDDGTYFGNNINAQKGFADFQDDDLDEDAEYAEDADDPANYQDDELN